MCLSVVQMLLHHLFPACNPWLADSPVTCTVASSSQSLAFHLGWLVTGLRAPQPRFCNASELLQVCCAWVHHVCSGAAHGVQLWSVSTWLLFPVTSAHLFVLSFSLGYCLYFLFHPAITPALFLPPPACQGPDCPSALFVL